MRWILAVFGLLTAVEQGWGGKIVAVLPHNSESRFIYNYAVLKALADHGNQVTLFSLFHPSNSSENISHHKLDIDMTQTLTGSSFSVEDIQKDTFYKDSWGYNTPKIIWKSGYQICDQVLRSDILQKILAEAQGYNLLITEALLGQECLLIIGHLLKIPTVTLHSVTPGIILHHVHGNDLQIATMPDAVSFYFSNHMSFMERFTNLWSISKTLWAYHKYHLPKHDKSVRSSLKYITPSLIYQHNSDIPSVSQMVSDISLSLVNYHPILGYPQGLSPNIIPVPGAQITSQPEPLSQEIQLFLDNATHGVLYCNMGLELPLRMIPEEYLLKLLTAFNFSPFSVLWRMDSESQNVTERLMSLPPHKILITQSISQQSVLAHRNVKLFVTNGGLLSMHEAINAGVPIVGIPLFGDQFYNIKHCESLHLCVGLDLFSLGFHGKKLLIAIHNVTHPKIRGWTKTKQLASIYKRLPKKPLETAVYWVEYVMRHNGTLHLRPRAALESFFLVYYMDMNLTIGILCTLVTAFVIFLLDRFIFSHFTQRNKRVRNKSHVE